MKNSSFDFLSFEFFAVKFIKFGSFAVEYFAVRHFFIGKFSVNMSALFLLLSESLPFEEFLLHCFFHRAFYRRDFRIWLIATSYFGVQLLYAWKSAIRKVAVGRFVGWFFCRCTFFCYNICRQTFLRKIFCRRFHCRYILWRKLINPYIFWSHTTFFLIHYRSPKKITLDAQEINKLQQEFDCEKTKRRKLDGSC